MTVAERIFTKLTLARQLGNELTTEIRRMVWYLVLYKGLGRGESPHQFFCCDSWRTPKPWFNID